MVAYSRSSTLESGQSTTIIAGGEFACPRSLNQRVRGRNPDGAPSNSAGQASFCLTCGVCWRTQPKPAKNLHSSSTLRGVIGHSKRRVGVTCRYLELVFEA